MRHGYVVAAPTYPLTSSTAFTGIPGPEVSDAGNQPADVSFVIDKLLQDDFFGELVDPERIGATGHSLGAVTSYFLAYGMQTRDPRIGAFALIGAGDPVQAALSSPLGFDRIRHLPVAVPVLFLSAEFDVFAGFTGRPYVAYTRVEPPKYEVMVRRGTHVWFKDTVQRLPGGRNPDCLFFQTAARNVPIQGCTDPVELIDPDIQQAITRSAVLAFFDAYLKGDARALEQLKRLDRIYPEVSERYQVE